MNEKESLVAQETKKHMPLLLDIFGEKTLGIAFQNRDSATEYMAHHPEEVQQVLDQITLFLSQQNKTQAVQYARHLPEYLQQATIVLWILFIEEKVRRKLGMDGISERMKNEREDPK